MRISNSNKNYLTWIFGSIVKKDKGIVGSHIQQSKLQSTISGAQIIGSFVCPLRNVKSKYKQVAEPSLLGIII